MTVNQKMRVLRKEKNITTTSLANQVGVSQSAIVRYENGSIQYIPVGMLKKIAAVLGCTYEELVVDDERYNSCHDKEASKSITSEETKLIMRYRELPPKMQHIVKEICNLHISSAN